MAKSLFRDVSFHFWDSASVVLLGLRKIQTSTSHYGRYGHRLVKLWEQKEYTTEPIQVWGTGGRLPSGPDKIPGKKWTARIGGGWKRQFFWVRHQRLTAEDIYGERYFCERVTQLKVDDNRSGYIALVAGPLIRRWIVATDEMKVGDVLTNSAKPESEIFKGKSGDAFPLKLIPLKARVCCVEVKPGDGAIYARSAGNSAILLRKTENFVILQLPSGREISVHPNCVAVLGRVSNIEHDDENWGSAKITRGYGIRPHSGLWHRKDGRHGRKIHPKKPMVVYDDAKLLKEKWPLED